MRKFLAAKAAFVVVLSTLIIQAPNPAKAGIPTIDIAGLIQAVLSALENVSQTLQMVEQYRAQLNQYENQLQNTLNPETWLWDEAQQTMNDLRRAVDTIEGYKNTLGSLDNYLDQFRDLDYYKNNPCFTSVGCSDTQRQSVVNARSLASESMKKANDALFKGLDMQQDALVADARQLERIQGAAQTAEGQVQAIQFANQLAGNQANQLLQIRSLLVTQQNATTSMLQADVDKQAQEEASNQKLRDPVYTPSTPREW